jgi:putative membrane protein
VRQRIVGRAVPTNIDANSSRACAVHGPLRRFDLDATAYCGAPPYPGAVAWNFDPPLFAALVLAAALHLAWSGGARLRVAAGWAVVAWCVVGPLCNLSVALFSARVAQHMLLVFIAAPLLAQAPSTLACDRHIVAATACLAAVIWLWHAPGPYDATFTSDAAYAAMQASLLATGVWFWRAIRRAVRTRLVAAFAALGFTALQMTAIGVLLTLASRSFYPPHAATTAAWGVSQLQDQQLGGILMWVPTDLLLGTVVLLLGARALARAQPPPSEGRPLGPASSP